MKNIFPRLIIAINLILGIWHTSIAQAILIDEPVQAGEMIVFPLVSDSNQFYYLPNRIRLALNENGQPQFSFLRYVQNAASKPGSATVDEGEGGGIVHALVELYNFEDEIAPAQEILRTKLNNPNAVIKGQVIYKGGTFSLISSFAEAGSDLTRTVIGIGRAPIFAGNKAAVSIRLTKLGAKILWESCQTPTPDLSFSFVVDFAGYRSPLKAKVMVDLDKVYSHHAFSGGLNIGTPQFALGLDIKAAFDELSEAGIIKVTNIGADATMEQLIDAAYKKLLDLMFEPFSMPEEKEKGNSVTNIINAIGNTAKGIRPPSIVSLNLAYEFKKQVKRTKYEIDLSKSSIETINFRFDENLGSGVKGCSSCFKSVNLDDPFYKQREILVSVDGMDPDQFNKYVNFVTVSMLKTHGGGQSTTGELRIGKKEFNDATGVPFHLLYGWKDNADNDRKAWLKYKYKTVWSFFGDYTVVKDWTETDQMGLNLAPPFHPVSISVEANPSMLTAAGIRTATVKFYFDYGAGEKTEQVSISGTEPTPSKLAQFMLKQDQYDYEYEIIWRVFGNKSLTSGRKKSSDSLLYVDEIPSDATIITN